MHRDEFVDYICHRDERLGLEFDSSWVNYFIIGHLVYAFPDAKFILLVRDCYTWVESIVNHMLTRREVQKSNESRNCSNILVFGKMKTNSNRGGSIDGNGATETGFHIF